MRIFTEILEGLRISLSAVLANKLRSALTTLGIIIGIVTVTLMSTAIEGINRAFKESIAALGSDVLYVQRFNWFNRSYQDWLKTSQRREITWQQFEAVQKQMTLAKAVAPVTETTRSVRYKNREASGVATIGTSDQYLVTAGLTVLEGRFMSEAESNGGRPVVILGYQVATNLFVGESALGKRVKIGNHPLEVIGVLQKQGSRLGGFSLDNRVVVPVRFFATAFRYWPDYQIQVKAVALEQLDEAFEELRGILRRSRKVQPGEEDNFSINQQEMFLKQFERVSGMIAIGGLFITGLSLFVGGIGIMNIMFVSVAERTREIGIRKAIGAKRRAILLQFLLEAAGICLLGGLIGLAIATAGMLALRQFMPASLSPAIVFIALSVSVATGLIAGFLPAWRAARMDPVEALRAE